MRKILTIALLGLVLGGLTACKKNNPSGPVTNNYYTNPAPVTALDPAIGRDWYQALGTSPFTARSSHGCVAYNDKLWVLGGYNGGPRNDVWSSLNGVQWTQAAAGVTFTDRTGSGAVSFNGKLWVMGGTGDSANAMGDTWSSPDGATWTPSTGGAATFTGRSGFGSAVYNGKIWVVGGQDCCDDLSDVWSSADGVSWTRVTADGGFLKRNYCGLTAFNGALWLIGGHTNAGGPDLLNDVWTSTDGAHWTQVTGFAEFTPRSGAVVLAYQNRLWILSGFDGTNYLNDVWSSADGQIWFPATAAAAFPIRYDAAGAVFNNRMWLTGGSNGGPLNSVWFSP